MKAHIELTRTIKQKKVVTVELTEEQIEEICEDFNVTPDQITYSMVHANLVDGGNGDKMALDESDWVNSDLDRDRKEWDGCCDKVTRDDGSISEWNLMKGFLDD